MSCRRVILASLIFTLILLNLPTHKHVQAANIVDFDNLEIGLVATELEFTDIKFGADDYHVMDVAMFGDHSLVELKQGVLGGSVEYALNIKFGMPQQSYSFAYGLLNCPLASDKPALAVSLLYDGELIQTDTFANSIILGKQIQEGAARNPQVIFNEIEISASNCVVRNSKNTTHDQILLLDYLETTEYEVIYYPTASTEQTRIVGRYADLEPYPLLIEPVGDVLRDEHGRPVLLEGHELDNNIPGLIIVDYTYVNGLWWYELILQDGLTGWIPSERIQVLTPIDLRS